MTWALFFLNFFFFVLAQNGDNSVMRQREAIDKLTQDEFFIRTQGNIYAHYILNHRDEHSDYLETLAALSLEGKKTKVLLLGQMAFRDDVFLSRAPNLATLGDQVLHDWWIEKWNSIREMQSHHPSYQLGLSSNNISITYWFSYQFVHSGFVHFLGNMFFLFIFGCALEASIGWLMLLVGYLASGFLGAGIFLLVSGVGAAPLIGASAAVSGLMMMTAMVYGPTPVRYLYLLFIPKAEYVGFVYLPVWVTCFLWILADLASVSSELSELGGVAHVAHIGGVLVGAGLGAFVLAFSRRYQSVKASSSPQPAFPLGTLQKFSEAFAPKIKH